jgi:cytosine/adenosine deaminase-related metal-dependent hydrolase
MTDFLVTGAVGLLTGLPGPAARAEGAVRVRGGRIAAVGALSPEPGEAVVDAAGCVVAPGFVNSHHHLFQSVLKAVPAGMNVALFEWLRLVPYTWWHRLDAEAMQMAATIGMAELALSGCTTVADHHYFYSDRWDFDPNEILFDTAARFGMRFVLCRGGATKARAFDTPDIVPLPTEPLDAMLRAVETAAARWHDPAPDAMRRVAMAPTTPTFSLEPGELREIAQAARGMGLRLHSHLSENHGYVDHTLSLYGQRPVHWLAGHDWLGPDVWFAHLVEADASEVAALAETGTGMAHCPQANARLGSGIAPADALSRAGGAVSLAVDGAAANEAADMGSALYAAFMLHRATKGAGAVKPEELVTWATAGGARVLGLPAIGTLEPSKDADLVLFDLSDPRWFGQHDAVMGPAISGGQLRVKRSFVKGREIVRDGTLPWLDREKLRADAARVVARLARGD